MSQLTLSGGLRIFLLLTLLGVSAATFSTEDAGTGSRSMQQAQAELATAPRYQPDNVIGKLLRFTNGEEIGPILDLRRRDQDSQLYLIIDATAFFNQSIEYAVPLQDVETVTADAVILPKEAGDHLRGMVYYEGDYSDIDLP